jgi:uncharacterized repeat protein (TIGR02543 family)
MFIFVLCCLSSCEFENPFLDILLYTVTFDVDGGEPETSTVTCVPGETVALPSDPRKTDYVFVGWYTDKNGGGTEFTEVTPIKADTRVYACWINEKDAVRVTFDADGGKPAKTTIVRKRGATVRLPSPNPTRDNHIFGGWYTEKEGRGNPFNPSTPITENITVYAKWILYPVVTFDADGGTPAQTTKSCPPGSTVRVPSAPTRAEYTFEGWYTDKNGSGTQFTSSTPVYSDIRVFAKWRPDPRVTFDADDGTPTITKTCASGATVALPPNPTKTGYVFYGWYTEKEGRGTKFTASTRINTDFTVYARWIAESLVLTVTFDAEGGTPVLATIMCIKGETLERLPADPQKDAHTFEGWYTEQDGSGTQFTAASVVDENITVYAKWTPYLVVTFNTNYGVPTISTVKCAPDTTIALPVEPVRTGYTFIGWYTEQDGSGDPFDPSRPITEDITLYAKWLLNLTVNGILELGINSIRFPNSHDMSLHKGAALVVVLSGSQVDWSCATWEIKVDAQAVSIVGNGASRIWKVPPDTKNGQYTVTVMVRIGSSLYVGNFSILITN